MNNNAWFIKEKPLLSLQSMGGGASGTLMQGASSKTYVDDVFSTYVYTGTGSARSINNGVDLSGEGGMVWTKVRNDSYNHSLVDTERGANKSLRSNGNNAPTTTTDVVTAFNSNGYSLGADAGYGWVNYNSTKTYSSWTFRKAPGFFDVVTWTGNGVQGREISHNLGSVPGFIAVKRTDGAEDWTIYHRSVGATKHGELNNNYQFVSDNKWDSTEPTSSVFTVGNHDRVNKDTWTYVAYVFAGGDVASGTSANIDITSKTVTNLGGTFDSTHTMAKMTDGILETSNAQNMAYVNASANPSNPDMDVYVDLDTPHVVTKYRIGPQGGNGTSGYNLVNNFNVYGTNDTSSWNFVAAFSPGQSGWTGGAYRDFEWGGGKSYRYWRIQVTQGDSGNNKSISEWKIEGYSAADNTDSYVFGEDGDKNIISCGGYTGNGSTDGPQINCGWEPQYVLVKNTTSSGDWRLFDSMRGIVTGGNDAYLGPNQNNAEAGSSDYFHLTSTGFQMTNDYQNFNTAGDTFVYICIRRPDGYVGKPADAGTDVFALDTGAGSSTVPNFDSTFPVDFAMAKTINSSTNWNAGARILGPNYAIPNTSAAWSGAASFLWDSNVGWNNYSGWGSSAQSWMWRRRAKGFDTVLYTGTGRNNTHLHSLNATPEMMWVKRRDSSGNWYVYHKDLNGGSGPQNYFMQLDTYDAEQNQAIWNNAPTSSIFSVSSDGHVNTNGADYIAMLFSSVTGISKVGSFTPDSSGSFTVTLGFTPRFIVLKPRTFSDNNWGWWVYDSVRGFSPSTTNKLTLESDAAQITGSTNGTTATGINFSTWGDQSSNNWIYYAHA